MVDISKCGCVAGFLMRKWGGRLSENVATPIIGTTAVELLGGDPERTNMAVINLSANIVYLSPRHDVSSTAGIRLAPNGGSITLDADTDGVMLSRQWYAVSSAAGGQLYVLTQRRVTSIADEGEQHADGL